MRRRSPAASAPATRCVCPTRPPAPFRAGTARVPESPILQSSPCTRAGPSGPGRRRHTSALGLRLPSSSSSYCSQRQLLQHPRTARPAARQQTSCETCGFAPAGRIAARSTQAASGTPIARAACGLRHADTAAAQFHQQLARRRRQMPPAIGTGARAITGRALGEGDCQDVVRLHRPAPGRSVPAVEQRTHDARTWTSRSCQRLRRPSPRRGAAGRTPRHRNAPPTRCCHCAHRLRRKSAQHDRPRFAPWRGRCPQVVHTPRAAQKSQLAPAPIAGSGTPCAMRPRSLTMPSTNRSRHWGASGNTNAWAVSDWAMFRYIAATGSSSSKAA